MHLALIGNLCPTLQIGHTSSLTDVIIMQEHGLEQIATHDQNILNLFFSESSQCKVYYTVDILPGLGDHDIVCVDIEM